MMLNGFCIGIADSGTDGLVCYIVLLFNIPQAAIVVFGLLHPP